MPASPDGVASAPFQRLATGWVSGLISTDWWPPHEATATTERARLTAAEVADGVAAIGMQAGKTVYYDVVIRRKDGKKTTAGSSVRDKREAEWLAVTIKKALGI